MKISQQLKYTAIEQLNAGARETATSIAAVGLSATELSETTPAVKMKI